MTRSFRTAVLLLVGSVAGCGGAETPPDASADGGQPDAAMDAATDAPIDSTVLPDTGPRTDAGCPTPDADGDGHASVACGGDDCDDADPMRYPGHTEVCDAAGHDEDCDPATYGPRDVDGDGFIDMACCNTGPSGPICGNDCNDMQANIHPTAPEVCNGVDDDCNGMVDEGVIGTFYADCDGDHYGGPESVVQCMAPSTAPTTCPGALWIGVGGDCDDARAATHPTATEICNAIDDNCDGTVDEGGDAACAAALPHTATATCTAGTCAVTTCAGAYLDCDAIASGCETDGASDPANCHTCTNFCSYSCTAGVCDDPVEIDAGGNHTCVRRSSGTVLCWGYNLYGQLGDGTTTDRWVPTLVPGITDAVEVSLGNEHTCVRHATGTVSCWGKNDNGQVGDGTMGTMRYSPTPVSGITNAVEIDAGDFHTCARLATGSVMCWGGAGGGVLGDGTTTSHFTPAAVSGLTNAIAVATGRNHTCAVRSTGAVSCWGSNINGQIGDGTMTSRTTPTASGVTSGAVDVIAGDSWTCTRLGAGGGMRCWGANYHGQLGNGTMTPSLTPVVVMGGAAALSISTAPLGEPHVCATTGGGGGRCWGGNFSGELGDGTTVDVYDAFGPDILLSVDHMAAGGYHSCAIASGALLCWGANSNGQLGDGTTTNRLRPTTVLPP